MSTKSAPPGPETASRKFEIEGVELGYPTEFRDGASAAGMFLVRSAVANELISESGFRVADVLPGRGLMALTGVHYEDTDCGTYEETAFAFFVEPLDGRRGLPWIGPWMNILRGGRAPTFTWKLQVNTTLSQQCGIQMWGFPKTVDQIDYERSEDTARFTLSMNDQLVFRFTVRPGPGRDMPTVASQVYSIFEGAPVLSHLTQRYRDASHRPRGGELELGDHPLANELRALGLSARPLLASFMGHLHFSMSAPEKL
jgi:hypothetical protein